MSATPNKTAAPAASQPVVKVTGLSAPPGAKGWLSGDLIGSEKPHFGRQIAKYFGGMFVDVLVLIIILVMMSIQPKATPQHVDDTPKDLVYLQDPGPSGGGGGSPAPAPPKKVEIPKPKPDVPAVTPVPVDPPPSISAPVENSDALQAFGQNSMSPSVFGGAGKGNGLGSGNGNGYGDGSGGGTGGGVYRPGSGIVNPVATFDPDPKYTSEAMRAKIQGKVVLEGTVTTDGKLVDIVVIQSLDKVNGLDDEAKRTATTWKFKPGTRFGVPVNVRVTIEMLFTLR